MYISNYKTKIIMILMIFVIGIILLANFNETKKFYNNTQATAYAESYGASLIEHNGSRNPSTITIDGQEIAFSRKAFPAKGHCGEVIVQLLYYRIFARGNSVLTRDVTTNKNYCNPA